jgi:GNAT superfamily N-acetyltransferase
MNVRVRTARRADAPAIAELAMQLYAEGRHDASQTIVGEVARNFIDDPRAHALLAFDDGSSDGTEPDGKAPIGLLTLFESVAMYAHGRFGSIQEMYIARPYRGRGVGRRLMEEAQRIAADNGWTRLEVTATPEHILPESAQFYRALGFEASGPRFKLAARSG